MTSKEKISIVVPIYKVEKLLERCVQSLLQQTYNNIEIILVDDGSPDACPKMCDEYAAKNSQVIVIHKQNAGLSDARNVGLKKACGKYVMYVDSDDYLEVDACERLIQGMEEDVDFVVGALREVRDNGIRIQKRSRIKEGIEYSAKDFIIESIKANEFYAPAVLNLYNREFLINNALFFKVGYFFEDLEMLPRLYLAVNKIVYIDYQFYNYIVRKESITTSPNSKRKIDISLAIYSEWVQKFKNVKDKELQKYMYGILVRYYLRNCRLRKITGWEIQGMDFKFALHHALNLKEKLKVILFELFPHIYIISE